MFFNQNRLDFFKPLTSKYREQVVQCLSLLYQRQYGSTADYGQALNRDQLLEILDEALAQSAGQVLEGDQIEEQRFKNIREQSNWVLKQLLACGWIERQVDPATLQSSFPFSRLGRLFSLTLIESDNNQIRTRHRNTRNTLNALEAFRSRGEIYDLLDAYEYSERIITDFTDVIAELEERKRELVREVEAQQLVHQATDQFFEFMEKRFQPDISIRLSADSVEKHREDIGRVIAGIRRKPKEFKKQAELQLRRSVADLCENEHSYLWHILDTVEQRMSNAAEVMLPALRRALHGFTKRADIIIRQLSFLNSRKNDFLLEVCRELADLNEQDYNERLKYAADCMAGFRLQWVDPQQVKLTERKAREQVNSILIEQGEINKEAQRDLLIQQLLDQAFVVDQKGTRDYLIQALKNGSRISTRQLPVDNARDLLAMAHIIEVGAINHLSSDFAFKVEPRGLKVTNNDFYHEYDEFTIELLEKKASPKQDS